MLSLGRSTDKKDPSETCDLYRRWRVFIFPCTQACTCDVSAKIFAALFIWYASVV